MSILLIFILIGLTAGIIAFLSTANLEKTNRYQQDLVMIIAPVFALCCFFLTQIKIFSDLSYWIDSTLLDWGITTKLNTSVSNYLIYLLIPICFYPLKRYLLWIRTKDAETKSSISNYFYAKEKKDKAYFLKNKFYYPLQYLERSIYVFTTLLFLSFLVAYLDQSMPSYIFLVLFFLLEFYWFMNGAVKTVSLEAPETPAEEEVMKADYFGLWKRYQSIWDDNLLQSFIYQPPLKSIKESGVVDDESLIINYKQDKIFETIQNKIIETVNRGKSIILFMPDHFQPMIDIEESEHFKIIQRILFKEEYVSQFYTTNIDELKKDKQIFINSIDKFLEQKLNIEQDKALLNWFEELGMVLYFGYDKSLIESPEATVSVSSILKYLCKDPEALITIVFAEDRQNSQAAFTSNIKVNSGFKEIRIQDTHPKLTLFLNWKKENSFEYGLFEAHYNKYIGPMASLMPLPYVYGVRDIEVQAANRPYIEHFEGLKKNKDAWLPEYNLLKEGTNQVIENYIHYLNHNLSFEHTKEKVIFLDDYANNAPLLFRYFNGFVKDLSFIQIFSGPHILRKYFNDHFEFFTASPVLSLSYLLLKEDRTTLALSLLEKLAKCKLTLDELYHDFNETNATRKIVLSQIKDLFSDVFDVDVIGSQYLEISENEEGEYLFSLKPDIKDHIELFRSVDFIDENNQPVFKKNKHLLFQKYAEGQYHSFNGRIYEINRIFKSGKNITIKLNNKQPQKNYFSYTEKRMVSIEAFEESDVLKSNSFNNNEYSIHVYKAYFNVHSTGFFEFDDNGFSLKEDDFTFHRVQSINSRKYKNGRLLRLRLKKAEGLNANGITTLRILFEEFAKIIFPDSYQFLIFRSFTHLPSDTEKTANKNIADYYQLNNQPMAANETTGICIFEDSIFDLGHLRSIKENIEYILKLIEDYLAYSINSLNESEAKAKNLNEHNLKSELPFLSFGLNAIENLNDYPGPIDLECAKEMVSNTLRNNNSNDGSTKNYLTNNRIAFYQKSEVEQE